VYRRVAAAAAFSISTLDTVPGQLPPYVALPSPSHARPAFRANYDHFVYDRPTQEELLFRICLFLEQLEQCFASLCLALPHLTYRQWQLICGRALGLVLLASGALLPPPQGASAALILVRPVSGWGRAHCLSCFYSEVSALFTRRESVGPRGTSLS